MKRDKKALLIAFVIGDGYIRIDSRLKNPKGTLKLCHSIKQKDYLEYKVNVLHSLVGGKKPVIREYTCTVKGKTYRQVRAEKSHKYFKVLRGWLYPGKYNYLKYLTPEAIAIWFMDDGSCVVNNRYKDGTCKTARTNLHTCTTKEQADLVCKYFKERWDIKFTTFKEKGSFSVRCFHKEGRKFHELIRPYIIPSMRYKQRHYYGTSAEPLEIR